MRRFLSSQAIETRIFKLNEAIVPFVIEHIKNPEELESSVLAITSKIISLAEGRIEKKSELSKEALVRRESDLFLGEIGYGCFLTISQGLFIASAGIDESNSVDGDYILFPKDPFLSAENIRRTLMDHYKLKNFGVVVTDSRTTPLRAGVTGVSLAHAGFAGVKSEIGKPDLFGRNLVMTQINVADAIATAAVFCMGEGAECAPLALVKTEVDFSPARRDECFIAPENDMYAPLYRERMKAHQKTA